MISSFRNSLNHSVIKIILAILLLSLVFGAGSIFFGQRDDIAFRVGDVEYTKKEWISFYESQMDRLGDEYKTLYNPEDLKSAFLRQLINSILIKQEAKRLSIMISDDAVKYEIINSMPHFVKDGKFDKDALSAALKKMGISESSFIRSVKDELTQRILMDLISHGNLVGPQLLEQLMRSLYSQRDVEIFEADFSAFKLDIQPTTEELQQTMDNHIELFTVPEERKVTFFKFNIENVNELKEKISLEESDKFYKDHSYLFQIPEKRKFLKLVLANKDEAEDYYKELVGGLDFKLLAKKLKQDLDLNGSTVTKDGFEEKLSQLIFSLNIDEVSKPTLTPLGWTIFKIVEIIPAATQPFSVVKDEIEKQIIERRCYDRYLEKVKYIDQDIHSGLSIMDLAKKYDFKLEQASLKIDQNNIQNESNILTNKVFLGTAFQLQSGIVSNVQSSIADTQSFVVQVDKITPAYTMSFESIKDKLFDIWSKSKIMVMAKDALIKARSMIEKSEDISKLENIKITKQRFSLLSDNILSTDQMMDIFTMPINGSSRILTNTAGNKIFIKVLSFIEPDPEFITQNREQESERIGNLKDVLLSDYFNYLKKTYKVEIKDISTN